MERQEWPVPNNVKQLKGFLGLTSYYRKFIKDYVVKSIPLTTLLKKNAFQWSDEAQNDFEELKSTMTQALVLALLDFNKTFTIETDASGLGIAAVVQQEGHPIAFLSKTLALKHQSFSTYKKLPTPFQVKWLPKLLGFDYEISYKSDSENVITDALSRVSSGAELNALVLTSITNDLMQQAKDSWAQDEKLQHVLLQLQNQTYRKDKYALVDGILRRKGKIVKVVKQAMRECDVCQREKPDLSEYPGLFQSLPIPEKIWSLIFMDFIKKLPSSHGKTVILVVVDRLSKTELRVLGGIECIFDGYAEHSKAFSFYVIEPNDSVLIKSIIESRDAIFDENRFSSVPRLSLRIPNGTEDIGGSVVPEEVTEEVVQQPEPDIRKGKRNMTPKNFRPEFQLYLIEGTRDKVDGTIEKFKARLVIQGFKQKSRIDYFDTYAPVARISTIRLLIAIASIHNLIIHQMDVKIAFLNGELDKDVYMNQPQGFIMPGNENKVCKLIKSLYRLKQAPKQWHQKFDEVVLSNGYLPNKADKCVYRKFVVVSS
ncbi:zinc finger, CCHC-type containing protein [Tanacetum coccineum]